MRAHVHRAMVAALAVGIGAALAAGWGLRPLRACLWDRDTLAAEARGRLDVVRVITGRFERNPPLYYAMRLERVAAAIASDPDDLEAYDDAGVACDRLGRGDEALAWMAKKSARLDALEQVARDPRDEPLAAKVQEHRYRLLANRGTFRVHRWFHDGADRSRIAEVRAARDDIAAAIEINPNAHFGREAIQLRILEWLIDPPKMPEPGYGGLPTFPPQGVGSGPADASADTIGLTGLIALGNAWESVDVFNALVLSLSNEGHGSIALMAEWRCRELVRAGKGSLVPDAPKGEELVGLLVSATEGPLDQKPVRQTYMELRAEAETWHARRTAFLLERLQKGKHPDTDRDFWTGYSDPGPPRIVDPALSTILQGEPYRAGVELAREMSRADALLTLAGLATTAVLIVRWRQRRRSSKPVPRQGVEGLEG